MRGEKRRVQTGFWRLPSLGRATLRASICLGPYRTRSPVARSFGPRRQKAKSGGGREVDQKNQSFNWKRGSLHL